MERRGTKGLLNFLGTHIISGTDKAIRTSNFVGTFTGSIGTNTHEKCWE